MKSKRLIGAGLAAAMSVTMLSGLSLSYAEETENPVYAATECYIGSPTQLGDSNVSIAKKPSFAQYWYKVGTSIMGAYDLGTVEAGKTISAKMRYKMDKSTAVQEYSLYVLPDETYTELSKMTGKADYCFSFDETYSEYLASEVITVPASSVEAYSLITVTPKSAGHLVACVKGTNPAAAEGGAHGSKFYVYDFTMYDGIPEPDPTPEPTEVPTPTPTPKPANWVEAEKAVVDTALTRAYTKRTLGDSKIEYSGSETIVYYGSGEDIRPVGTIFRLTGSMLEPGETCDISMVNLNIEGTVEYAVFTSPDAITLETVAVDEVKTKVTSNAAYNTLQLAKEMALPQYTVKEKGYLYVYAGMVGDTAGEPVGENGTFSSKFQMNLDYFIVDLSSGTGSIPIPTATPKPTPEPTAAPTPIPGEKLEAERAVVDENIIGIGKKREYGGGKIEWSNTNALVYYGNGAAPVAAVFRLTDGMLQPGDVVDIAMISAHSEAEMQFAVFTSEEWLKLQTAAVDEVKPVVKENAVYTDMKADAQMSLPTYTVTEPGYLYVYGAVAKDGKGNTVNEEGKFPAKYQLNLDYFMVNLNGGAKPEADISYENGRINCAFTNVRANGTVYAAEYDADGRLVNVKATPLADTVTIELPETANTVKVYVWNTKQKPLFETASFGK